MAVANSILTARSRTVFFPSASQMQLRFLFKLALQALQFHGIGIWKKARYLHDSGSYLAAEELRAAERVSSFITKVNAQYEERRNGLVVSTIVCNEVALVLIRTGLNLPPFLSSLDQAMKTIRKFETGIVSGDTEELGG
ncbi:hypothetical protein SAMN05880590_1362 [Rhizobium sp. RU35A]|nr:hypothetical protein SAMN05880590_1362 [Rhizobium sp. RU35A]